MTICKQCKTTDCAHIRNGKQRAKAFTSDYQKQTRSHVKTESLINSGKAGYAALEKKKGKMFAARKAADYRRSHPSGLEQIVGEWLNNLIGNHYSREAEVEGGFFVDFLYRNYAIEVHGAQWHEKCELRQDQPDRDKRKYATLTDLGYTVVILPEKDVKSGEARKTLENLLRDYQQLDF